ncbi:MAG: uroporphyrinogen-III C-methyltransferase [Rhodospirillales bacterium]|jgi:uroporphyrin-III C-methyltransferase|nr:uroporphyrinogen-III C-methyltransferase [Rhodospirillales bacterium]MBT4038934.1 uroporphyrinogen-III C-methyltransferase [Rhodospirillales bacterium]MBT4625319.1 uroporphyrinogen-III C-methyltransferase [Rhodospirillales bacterium]MBT5353267.1 uroporphyrinogen-III C-methyltransferase [Rhodospirillales bacterium]MBT5521764.1 uroporphyrinogen-III C-methyltransferase [Rhodospirillales bacterium]
MTNKANTVYLVGAGPGDPDLLTVKALRLIQQADVVVYDRLVSDPILALIPGSAKRVFAGKRARDHYMPQDEINALLVETARSGQMVVRLKGGDPFVFGRGGEEAVQLAKNNIKFEVVPGITSSAGCAAYAGIPLTHRDHAHSVRFVTGHTQHGDEPELNWQSLADPTTTLVVYMGMSNAPIISKRLIEAGLDADTPAAAINMGTRPEQQVVRSTLKDLPQAIVDSALSGATLLVIGSVVDLADTISWFNPED